MFKKNQFFIYLKYNMDNINEINKCILCKSYLPIVTICSLTCLTITCEYCGKDTYLNNINEVIKGHNPNCNKYKLVQNK